MRHIAAAVMAIAAVAPARAQLTSVSPTSYAFEMVADTASGPYGPVRRGVAVTLSGTGTVTWDGGTCFGGYASNVPSKSGTLPMTVIFYYGGYQSGTCTVTFTGGSGGTGTFAMSIAKIPNTHGTVSTDMLGNLLGNLGYCSNPSPANPYGQSYRIERACTLQEGTNIRPGGTRVATAQGASYIDATYGAKVVNQGSGLTRSYVAGNQISYNKDYVVAWNGTNAVLHKIDAVDNSGDLAVSGPSGVCNVGSSANIGLGTTAASATLGFCLHNPGTGNYRVKKFSFTGGIVTDLGTLHDHDGMMRGGFWGTGQAAADGWLSHFHAQTVAANGQTGTSLQMRDFTFSSTVAVAGDTFTIGNDAQVYTINATITSDSTGLATLTFTPALTSSPEIGTGVLMSNSVKGGKLCVLRWFDSSPADTCISAIYPIRNATMAAYPSRSTGLHYVFVGSDTPNKTTAYAFDPVARTLSVSGRDVPIIDSPAGDSASAKWDNGTCVVGVDCAVAGHHNMAYWGGEPYDCGTGRGRIQQPNYTDGGACVRGYGWNTTTGHDVDAIGGPVYPAQSPLEEYFIGASAPVLMTSGGYGGQGLIPAWRISSCTASAGNATCTLAASGNLDGSGWAGGTTPIYVDGFSGGDTAFNGRFTLTSKTSTTFTYACAGCAGTTASNVASVAKDTAVSSQVSALTGLGGVRVCRPGLGHCRTLVQPMNVSYGNGNGAFGAATGNWQGANGGSLGFQALNHPTLGQWGERACWVTDWGYLETLFVACAATGRADLGLAPFDLDQNTPDNCFDRHGRCIDATNVGATSATISVKPTNPAFLCTIDISTRRDFGTIVGSFGLNGPGSDRSSTPTGLTSNTQYFASAKCGPSAARVWDYGVVAFRTK